MQDFVAAEAVVAAVDCVVAEAVVATVDCVAAGCCCCSGLSM